MIRSAQAGCSSNQTTPTCVEDPVSHDRHVKLMRKEFSKVHKNLALGAELMEVTFTGRRQEVIELPVKEAINRYPFLQNYEEVSLSESHQISVQVGSKHCQIK